MQSQNYIKHTSSWEFTKARSQYHFDNERKDLPGEWYTVLGQFPNTWTTSLGLIKNNAFPMTWENRKQTMGRVNASVSPMLDQEEYDIIIGGGNPKMALVDVADNFSPYPELQAIINFFGLSQTKSRIHIQKTGQVFNRHIDKLDDLYPAEDPANIIRFAIMLEDWEPGQFYQYGNDMYDRWKAGDCHCFDWRNVPHATANASNYPRCTLQITGIRTEVTDKLLSQKTFTQFII
jgi:hypothetical protein